MEKTITVKRHYGYLVLLILFGLLIAIFTEAFIIHYDSLEMEEFAKENNIYPPFSSDDFTQFAMFKSSINKNYLWMRSAIMFFCFLPLYIVFSTRTKNDFFKITMISYTITTIIVIVVIGTNDFEFGTNLYDRWEIRLFYLALILPLGIMVYDKVILGNRLSERVYKKNKIEYGFNSHRHKLQKALDNQIITQEEYDQKINEQKRIFIGDVVLTDKEYVDYKHKLDTALTDRIISKEEYERKLKDFREKRLEELNK
ncbi:MAG TPA: hypothetical protein EYO35_05600 [Flavobacteriaceae bacterium]|nr:hypothetical protein [Flavobacteriaceae bacterium]